MKDLGKVVIHIPARAGSKRVPQKNLRFLNGKPMIGYAIDSVLKFSEIGDAYVNTDSVDIIAYAKEKGIGVYERSPELASDSASGDDFTIDIISNLNPDTLIMISPVCPLITDEDIEGAIKEYKSNIHIDTLISTTATKMQTAVGREFVNIEPNGPLAPSQDNPIVHTCNWAITIWDCSVFKENYKKFKGGYCGMNRLMYPIDPLHAVKVSYEEDFQLVDSLFQLRKMNTNEIKPVYWKKG